MKTVLPTKHLLYTLFLCLFCCSSLSVLARDEDKSDDILPGSPPPILPYNSNTVTYKSLVGSLEIIFLEEAKKVEVEVVSPNGTVTIVNVEEVSANGSLQVDTRRWSYGSHTLLLKVNGRLVSISAVQLK